MKAAQVFRPDDFYLITDRPCDAEDRCKGHGIAQERIECGEREAFSQKAAEAFRKTRCGAVIMFFSRLVSSELFAVLPTLNIHPSFLPSYPGMRAVRAAQEDGGMFLGATLHLATAQIDGGPIVGQVVSPVEKGVPPEYWNRLSYLQKVYLTLVAFELISESHIDIDPGSQSFAWKVQPRSSWCANPKLRSVALAASFDALQKDLGVRAVEA